MPRKPAKPREKKVAEEFFRVEPRDLNFSVEKKHRPMEVEIPQGKKEKYEDEDVRAEIKPVPKKKKAGKFGKKFFPKEDLGKASAGKTFARKAPVYKPTEFHAPEISLKKEGYELVITEKPQAALKIASALGKATKKGDKGVPFYEVSRKGKKIVVACAVGHLFTLTQKQRGAPLPVFELSWVPNYMARKNDFTKRYYDSLVKLARGASSVTVATDYDVEGEVIGYNIVRFVVGQKDASRMKFSTLTEKELNEAYDNKSSSINWGQAIAGETRHHLDWIYGINLSRLLMNAIKSVGSFRIFSVGRVQGPTLNLIVEKEREIQAFKPVTYWNAFITISPENIELVHNKEILDKKVLGQFENLKNKEATVSTKKSEESLQPNPPFNLTTLQTEAYRLFGMNPARTLATAQSLYLAGLISYPRTSSQKLPAALGYSEIVKSLAAKYDLTKLIKRQYPVEGSKTDPAHPSIYPTGNYAEMELDEKKIYELIVKRFLCLFMEDAVVENKTITADYNGLKFSTRGSSIKKESWLGVYPSRTKEKNLPDVEGSRSISECRTEEKQTQPPKRYSPASIIAELEKRNLGTKATRASMLETLYDRGYIQDQSIKATPLGLSMISTLEKHSPVIIDEALTRDFEKDMEEVLEATSGFQEKEQRILEKAHKEIKTITKKFVEEEKEIGNELMGANTQLRVQQREENKLNQCPLCGKGNLSIMYSKKTRRYFIACDKYPDCKNTYSVPPNSLIKKADSNCETCSWPKLISIRRAKRPWIFCFNKDCESNKERLEAYRKKKEAEAQGQVPEESQGEEND